MIDILMTTYNGAQYLDEQLASLFEQRDAPDVQLYIRDDASSDDTQRILKIWHREYPGLMHPFLDLPHTGDPGSNFLSLLEDSRAPYVMYCDQDDIWKPDKIAATLRLMHEEEHAHPGAPILVHSDLAVVSKELVPVSDSFMRYQKLDSSAASLPQLIVQNNISGCTVMMNGPLRALIRTPSIPVLHDWWTALTAAAFGHIAYLDKATVLYRQHAGNAVGAQNVRSASHILRRFMGLSSTRMALHRTYETAAAFLETYADMLDEEQKRFLLQYSQLKSAGIRGRARILSEYGAFKNGALRAAAQILLG